MTDEPATPTSATSTDPATGPDRDFLANAIKALVDKPEDVIIKRTIDDLGVLITVQVGADDMSKLIGKAGRTAKSLRTLLRVVGAKHDLRSNMKILEPDGSEYRAPERDDRPTRPPRAPRPPRAAAPAAKTTPAPKPAENKDDGASAGGAFDNII